MKHVVFYDAQCPFCYQIKRVFSKFDWLSQIKWVSVQAIEQSGKYPYLEGRNTLDEIHMLTKEGEIKKGFFTIRRLMLVLPPVSLIGLLLYLPGLNLIGDPFYQWFSSHRYQWFGRYEYPRYS